MYGKLINRFWDSPTFMTWGSLFARSLSFVIVIPLVLSKFSSEEISLWFLFATMISLQNVANLGFTPTFIRVISYAVSGIKITDLSNATNVANGKVDKKALNEILQTMNTIFIVLAFFWLILLSTIGTFFLVKPVNSLNNPIDGWIAWIIIIIFSSVSFFNKSNLAYFQGIDQIPFLRRMETLTSFISISLSTIVLLFYPNIIWLIFANQIGLLFLFIILQIQKKRTQYGVFFTSSKFFYINKLIIDSVWPSAWRSGIGVLSSFGITQFTGIIFAQTGNTSEIASYLFGLRIIQLINQFSQAPFYSKIPYFNKLYAQKEIRKLLINAKKSMLFAYFSYIIPFFLIGMLGEQIFELIHANIAFPSPWLWSLFGLAFFIERFGAMHIQLYSLTNKIIWHKANGITGLINIFFILLLYKRFGYYSFPLSFIISYLLFYSWYSAKHSYVEFKIKVIDFEKSAVLSPLVILIIMIILINFK